MLTFITRRLFFLIFVLFGISTIVFGLLMTFSPARRASVYINNPHQVKDIPRIIEKYHLNDPFYKQYFRWLNHIAHGNFGYSVVASMPVKDAFLKYIPVSLELNLYGTPILIMLGIWLGTLAALKKDKAFDHITRILSVVAYSPPTFLVALILLMFFYGYFNWFPPGIVSDQYLFLISDPERFHKYTYFVSIDALLNHRFDIFKDSIQHLVMPVLSYILVLVAMIIRIMRSGLIEELTKDYIITAKAKGADQKTIDLKHARRNALLPVITVAGQLVAFAVVGSISVEVIFNRPGVGLWLANAATQLDMPVLMGVCLFVGFIVVIVNLLVDIIYAYVDPRIRLN